VALAAREPSRRIRASMALVERKVTRVGQEL
jgi:hypothetical protein